MRVNASARSSSTTISFYPVVPENIKSEALNVNDPVIVLPVLATYASKPVGFVASYKP